MFREDKGDDIVQDSWRGTRLVQEPIKEIPKIIKVKYKINQTNKAQDNQMWNITTKGSAWFGDILKIDMGGKKEKRAKGD